MTAYPGQTLTRTMLGQLCAALWDSQSQPGIEPGSEVMPLALRCSALGLPIGTGLAEVLSNGGVIEDKRAGPLCHVMVGWVE